MNFLSLLNGIKGGRPTCPTTGNNVGTNQYVENIVFSDMSDTKNCNVRSTVTHPWPVLFELNENFHCDVWPAPGESGIILYPAAGLLLSEKLAALQYAQENIDALLHDLALEHLPRQVWLDGRRNRGRRGRNARDRGQSGTGSVCVQRSAL